MKNFLWSLGIRKEKNFFEINRDYKEMDEAHIQKEALSVLRQDVQALLTQLSQGKTLESKHNHLRNKNGNHFF
jgi:hypothetical protein